jgi:hypothetical protein
LFKTILRRPNEEKTKLAAKIESMILSPAPFSVSKLNQMMSFYIVLVWGVLIIHEMLSFGIIKTIILLLSGFFCCWLFKSGISHMGSYTHNAGLRKNSIEKNES